MTSVCMIPVIPQARLTNRTDIVDSLQISGESLSGDGIHTDDINFVLQTPNFDIERKLYNIQDPATGKSSVRHLYHKCDRICIESSNPDYEPLLLEEVEVIGRVIYIQPQGKAANLRRQSL